MDAELADRAAYLPDADALVVADVHAGRARASNVDIPLGERADLVDRLEALLARFDPAEVVLAGDVLHAFSHLPEGAAATVDALTTLTDEADAALVAVAGNHDVHLDSVLESRRSYRLSDGETVVLHGHERPEESADRYVIGHDHPAIAIEGRKRPCALWGAGAYRGSDLLVLPAFTRLAAGVTVNGMRTADFGSPLVRESVGIDAFRPFVSDDDRRETLRFPPLGELRRLL